MDFKIVETGIDGLIVIEPKVFNDDRGYFMETYNEESFKKVGLNMKFVQDNESHSTAGVLRGLHFQKTHPQGKLVRCTEGMVYDVAVDLRDGSKTFGKWYGVVLDPASKKMFYIPEGFAHGFLVMTDEATFNYKCTDVYTPGDEGGIMWNDPDVGIKWPAIDKELILSDKDKKHPLLKDLDFKFKV